ncbi:alpha/beta hydrolase domain containing protein 1,3, putative [Pediculus humanus corporis]|uniref:Alpha/beta hydrolase domain containing protein 1,3, putative n=1 Tax=Pediculus humanus subsp. corporis TaxID=121224 RepID=E0W4A6_PEDHC|nr:alpha/beta hydrolase domain containing protein 1,3, putative [Pediculus humanus corporis]EEB20462.1 alpha/beta hydrolase domain containing protein 1,3, putative [Pediculus humanus corporis]
MFNFGLFGYGLMEYTSGWYLAGLLITGYISYYLFEVVKQPQLVCAPCKFRKFLESNLPILHEKYWPTFWCCESRAQTVMAAIVRRTLLPYIQYRREILTLRDGGEVALDWKEENTTSSSPVVLLFPGLTGTSQTEYVKALAISASKSGIRFVVFNNRGLGGMALKTPRLYCAANVDDASEVISHVKKLYPTVPLGVLGVSLGGMILGNYMSRMSDESQKMIAAAMLISVPWNVFVGTKSLEKPILNYLINRHLAFCLVRTIKERSQILDCTHDLDQIVKSRTVREFDTRFTAKHFGYENVSEYYTEASLHTKIPLMKVPTLCLSAADDPMQPLEGIPVEDASKSESVAILIPSRGGHIGFMEGLLPIAYDQYMARCFTQYFNAMFENDNYKQFFTTGKEQSNN